MSSRRADARVSAPQIQAREGAEKLVCLTAHSTPTGELLDAHSAGARSRWGGGRGTTRRPPPAHAASPVDRVPFHAGRWSVRGRGAGRVGLRAVGASVAVAALVGCAPLRPDGRPSAIRAPGPTDARGPAGAVSLPARYDEGRWIVRPVTAAGDTLDLYTDTGGGFLFVARERLDPGAPVAFAERGPDGDSLFTAPWPAFRPDAAIPAPLGAPAPRVTTAAAAVFRRTGGPLPARDGFLGNGWFAGRRWVFDYPARTLALVANDAPAAPLGRTTVPIGLKNRPGVSPPAGDAPWFPRVRVAVDGDSLDLLFDTGATTVLTDSAVGAVGDGRPASRAASFVARTVFDRWRRDHPAWRVVARAEARSGADMIEVPAVTVGGLAAGPVWFTSRPDPAFAEFMSRWMDRPVVGALGGSALRYFRVDLDYPHRRATFARP